MAARVFQPTSFAFNPERARTELWRGVALPEQLLQKALNRLNEQLDAKKTLHFTHQGQVVEQVDVEDNQTRAGAIDKVLSISGAYVKKEDTGKNQTPHVTLVVDQETGVIRLEVGGSANAEPTAMNNGDIGISSYSGAGEELSTQLALPLSKVLPADDNEEPAPEIIKVRKGGLPRAVYETMFGDD